MSELEEFAGLLAAATKKKIEQFDYASLVSGGSWKAELACSFLKRLRLCTRAGSDDGGCSCHCLPRQQELFEACQCG